MKRLRVVALYGPSQQRAIRGELLRVLVELREDDGGAVVRSCAGKGPLAEPDDPVVRVDLLPGGESGPARPIQR